VVARVDLGEALDEDVHVVEPRLGNRIRIADHGDLPQQQSARCVDRRGAEEKVRRVKARAAGRRRVDAEIGEHAILRRDGGEHPSVVPLGARASDRLVGRPDVDARMAVESRYHAKPLANRHEHALDDPLVDRLARFTDVVLRAQAGRSRMEAEQPLLCQRVSAKVQQLIRRVDCRACLRRQVHAHADPGADHGQRAARHVES